MKTLFIILEILFFCSVSIATDWFVSQAGAGEKNGTSYANAWNGLKNVVWGEGGVVPGDTLYVCGLHIWTVTSVQQIAAQGDISMVTGTSEGRITVRGDYPDDAGVVWGAAILQHEAWNDEGDNVWSITCPATFLSDWFFEDVTAETWTVLDKLTHSDGTLTGTWTFTNASKTVTAAGNGDAQNEIDDGDWIRMSTDTNDEGHDPHYTLFYEVDGEPTDADTITLVNSFAGTTHTDDVGETVSHDLSAHITTLKANAGSHYSPDYRTNTKLYIYCSDGLIPTGRIAANRIGYDWKVSNCSYLTFQNITFYSLYQQFDWSADTPGTNITFDGCTLSYGDSSSGMIVLHDNCHYFQAINCILTWAGNGIYFISSTNNAPSNYIIRGTTFQNIGVRAVNQNSDAHGFGFQGGHDGLIEDNTFDTCGTGPTLYAGTNQDCKNNIIRNNTIKDLHNLGAAKGYGFGSMGGSDPLGDTSGNYCYGNVVIRASRGARSQFPTYPVYIYNNTFYECDYGFESTRNDDAGGANFVLRNNVFLNSTYQHIRFSSGATSYTIDSNYNSFYPDANDANADCFKHSGKGGTITSTEWKAISVSGSTFDTPNSIFVDPLLVGAARNKFAPTDDSPLIGAGENVGLSATDTRGNLFKDDIGAYMYCQYGLF